MNSKKDTCVTTIDGAPVRESEKTWCVYTLADNRSPDEIRYVGITTNPDRRLKKHKRPKPSDLSYRANWARSVTIDGGDIILRVLFDGLRRDEAASIEIEEIARRRINGERLVNLTDGGEGVSGYHHTDEAKEKIGAGSARAWVKDEQAKSDRAKKIKQALSRQVVRDTLSRVQKDLWANPVIRAHRASAIRESTSDPQFHKMRGKALSLALSAPDARQRKSLVAKALWKSPAYRRRATEAMETARQLTSYKDKMSSSVTKSWEDDGVRERRILGINNAWSRQGARERHSEIMTNVMNSGDVRERIGYATRLKPPKKNSTSHFKGVNFCTATQKWRAKIFHNGKTRHIGRYAEEDAAARAYDAAAYEAWGSECYLNFPNDLAGAANDNTMARGRASVSESFG